MLIYENQSDNAVRFSCENHMKDEDRRVW